MIIECICGEKKFEVSPELIPASGRTIKCGSCDKIWFYKPENLENENQNYTKKTNDIILNLIENIKSDNDIEIQLYSPTKNSNIEFLIGLSK